MLELVAALDRNRAIGAANRMPWHLPDDLAHFKRLTLGRTVLMGRKTFLSIGRPLPKRRNLVLTRDSHFEAKGIEVLPSLEAALQLEPNPVIIGGGEIYALTLPLASTLHLTFVHTQIPHADAFFPVWDEPDWLETTRQHHPKDERHAYDFDWVMLERR
ncbi:MAG: dihydrofolate reductase [Deinococcales bacterium]